MSDHIKDAFLRQRRNLVITSSVLLVYVGAEVKLRIFNGVVVSGEVHNEQFLVSFMLVLIGYFLIRFFQCMQSQHGEFRIKWHEMVKSKSRRLVHLELIKHLNDESKNKVALKDAVISDRDLFVHIVDKGVMASAIEECNVKNFVLYDVYNDEGNNDGDIDVVHIDKKKAIRFWIESWFSVSWRTALLTEYYLPVVYSIGVIWWYLILKI